MGNDLHTHQEIQILTNRQLSLLWLGHPNTPADEDPLPQEPLSPKAFGKQDDRDILLTIHPAPSQSFWYVDYYSVSNFVAAEEFLT